MAKPDQDQSRGRALLGSEGEKEKLYAALCRYSSKISGSTQ